MTSELMKILRRLQAMRRDQTSNRQTRVFEEFGVPLCEVTYIRQSDEFVYVRYRPTERFRFDDVDLVAIEIFNCLYDFKQTF
ncbi:DUF1797 family protein [Lactobacillaceae bacterium 24-114]